MWPFDATTVWNVPVGAAAVYAPANLFPAAPPRNIFSDDDYFITTAASDPRIDWVNQGHWNSTPDCDRFPWAPVVGQLHWPADLTITEPGNNALALLQPDNDTLVLTQPAYRCGTGNAPLLSLYNSWHPNCSLRGGGNWGGHGGSELNAIGGTLRLGELLPSSASPPRHALKLQLWAKQYYYGSAFGANKSTCYTWPALDCDGYSNDPTLYNGSNPLLRPGALLAIPPAAAGALNASLSTEPARRLLWTLVNYGGYLCDDTYADRATFNTEHGVTAEFGAAWGYAFDAAAGGSGGQALWLADVTALFRALSIVTSNSPTAPGGGGAPLQPPPPPFCA